MSAESGVPSLAVSVMQSSACIVRMNSALPFPLRSNRCSPAKVTMTDSGLLSPFASCIFSVALGRKLGLTKLQLYDLGMAALFHDVGKSRVPLEVRNKQGALSAEEWRIMQ